MVGLNSVNLPISQLAVPVRFSPVAAVEVLVRVLPPYRLQHLLSPLGHRVLDEKTFDSFFPLCY